LKDRTIARLLRAAACSRRKPGGVFSRATKMAVLSDRVPRKKSVRLRLAVAWSVVIAGLGLVAACGGGGGGNAAAVALAAAACPGGQIALESGCADAAATAEQVRGVVRDAMVELDLGSRPPSTCTGAPARSP
jgi:hypothetical protein